MGNLAVISCKFESNCNEIRKMRLAKGKGKFHSVASGCS